MTISDAEYTAWLLGDNKKRCVLVEAQAYSSGATVTRYFSNLGFTTLPSDSPANTPYDDILVSVPAITSRMGEFFRGRSVVGYGDIEVDNSNGERDSWLLDSWDGRPVAIYMGDPDWPKADFRRVFLGVTEDIQARSNSVLTLRIRDRQFLLAVPALTTLIGGTDSTKDQRRPACYGECKRIVPVLIDSATRTYAVHDGQIQSVDAVYVAGAPIATYTANLTNGTITLTAALTGFLSADVKGSKTGGVYVNTTADIAKRLITERSSITAGEISSADVTALNTDSPGVVGLFINADSSTVLDAMDVLMTGAGASYSVDRSGTVRMAMFKAPSGTPAATLVGDDIDQSGVELIRRILPLKSVRLGYARFYSNLDVSSTGLNESDRQRLRDELLVAKATNSLTGFLLAVDGDLERSNFVSSADASTEASRRATLYSVLRRVFRIRGFLAAQQVVIGDVISVTSPRHGFSGGVLVRVVAMRENLTGGRVELEVFV